MKSLLRLLAIVMFLLPACSLAADKAAYPALADGSTQYAAFPRPLETYPQTGGGIIEILTARAKAEPFCAGGLRHRHQNAGGL